MRLGLPSAVGYRQFRGHGSHEAIFNRTKSALHALFLVGTPMNPFKWREKNGALPSETMETHVVAEMVRRAKQESMPRGRIVREMGRGRPL